MAKRKSAARAPRGTGTVFWSEPRNCWVARKPIGKRGKDTVYLTRTGATQAEAIRRRDAALPPDPAAATVGDWAARWLADLAHKPLTLDSYRNSVEKYIVPQLGPVPLRALTAHGVESAARTWGRALGANTVRLVLAHLSACLSAAVRDRLIPANPVDSAIKPKATKTEIDPFTPAELVHIVGACGPGDEVIAILAATGLRRGEALALDRADFDPVAGTVAVTKTDVGRHGIGSPKSPHSVRTIRVPAVALPAVERAAGQAGGALFPGARGPRVSDSAVADRFAGLLARAGLRRRNLHQLRHSVATAMISAGEPLGDVAAYMGDTVDVVVRTYLHATGGDPAACLDRVFGAVEGVRKVSAGGTEDAREPENKARGRKGS